MRRFLLKIALLLLPVFLVFGLSWTSLFKAGEFLPFQMYVHPLDSGQLFGLAYVNYDKAYKFHMTDDVSQPQVLALGSSRIMQVKRSVVNPRYSFYNAGGAIQNIYEMPLFVEQLQNPPAFILLTIDQYWFNPAFERQRILFDSSVYDVPDWDLSNFLESSWTFYEDYAAGKVSLSDIWKSRHVGLNAICKENGFAADGTRYPGDMIKAPEQQPDYNFRDILDRIDKGDRRFQYGDEADSTLIDGVDRFLAVCASRGIRVAAFLPPFSPVVYQKMTETGRYGYLTQIYPMLNAVFSKYDGFRLYDFTDVTAMGVHNYDFIDGFHGSERVYNQLIRQMVLSDSTIAGFFVPIWEIEHLDSVYRARQIHYHSIP